VLTFFFVNMLGHCLLSFFFVSVCSPIAAIMAMFGSIIGMAAGVAVGAVPENIYFGLWGYNAALGAITVGGTHSQE
jgi:urea transporter